ncbi:MAG: PAS domain S-box protein, partial [Elusimicrobia bacterium]|nr:PAS domain S-box protein [Elusimicrobiota bacterium]MBD3412189.1 PAS domain S-box protein [Elusimicrobiota bacterium]
MLTQTHRYALEEIKIGDHICCLYKSEIERFEQFITILNQGILHKQKIICFTDDFILRPLISIIQQKGLMIETYLGSGQVEFRSSRDIVSSSGIIDHAKVFDLMEKTDTMLNQEGFAGLRMVADLTIQQPNEGIIGSLFAFESKLNTLIPQHTCLLFCQYNSAKTDHSLLTHVLHLHPLVMIGNDVYRNTHHIPHTTSPDPQENPGALQHYLSAIRDNPTEPVTAEPQDNLTILHESVPLPFFKADINTGKLLHCNAEFARYFGYSEPSFIINDDFYLSTYYDEKTHRDIINHLMQHHTLVNREITLLKNDGSIAYILVSASAQVEQGFFEGVLLDITRLKISEERNRSIIQTAMDGFFVLDQYGNFIEVNDALCRMTGFSREDLLSMKERTLDVKRSIKEIMRFRQAVSRTGPARYETKYRCRDGNIIDVEISTGCSSLNGGGYISFVHEITQRKKREYELQMKSENLEERIKELNCLFSVSNLIEKYKLDLDRIIQGVAEQIPPAWHYPESTCARIVIKDREYKTQNFKKTSVKQTEPIKINDKKVGYIEVYYLHNDDFYSHKPFLKEENKLLTSIAQRLAQAIEHVNAETNLKKYHAHLEELIKERTESLGKLNEQLGSEMKERTHAEEEILKLSQFLSVVIENANVWFLVLDQYSNILLWNKAAEVISGYSREEVLGKKIKWSTIITDKNFERTISKKVDDILYRGEVLKDYQVPIQTKHGEQKIISWNVKNLLDESGKPRGLIALGRDITEQQKTEDALKKSEERFRKVVEDQTELICRFLPDGRLTFVNEAYCRYFGKTADELIGKSFLPFIPKSDHDMVRDKIKSTTPEKPSVRIEHRVVLPNGRIRWQEWNNRKIFDNRGKIVELQAVGYDITERIKAQEKLIKSEEKFRTLFHAISGGIFVRNRNGIITDANDYACTMLGLSESQLLGLSPFDFSDKTIKEDGTPYSPKEYPTTKAIASGKPMRNVCMGFFNQKTGTYRWLIINAEPIVDPKTHEVISAVTTFIDITERKKIEQELIKEKELLQTYLDVAGVMFLVIESDETVSLINKRGCEVLGLTSSQDIIGKNWFMNFVPESHRKKIHEVFKSIIKSGSKFKRENYKEFEYYENPVITPSGELRTIAWHNTVITDRTGRVCATLSSGEDITPRLQAEHEKNVFRTYMIQSEKMASLGALSSGIAIKLKGIFDTIKSHIEQARGIGSDESALKHLG